MAMATPTHLTLSPAYGRDYKSKAAVLEDLHAGKDFVVHPAGCYANLADLRREGVREVTVRYQHMTKALIVKVPA